LRLSPEERRKKDQGGHAHYEMVYDRRPSDRVLAAFHDPDNVMHDVLNAYHWIRRQLHEAQTTDLTGRRSDNRNVKRGGDYPRPLSICPHAQLRNGRLLHRPAPRHLDGGEHERAAGWQADGIRRADRRDAKRLTYRSR
jgi:hypothetical protein